MKYYHGNKSKYLVVYVLKVRIHIAVKYYHFLNVSWKCPPPSRPNFYDNAPLPLENVTRAVSFSKITRKKICLFFDPNHYAISIHVQKIDMRRWKFDLLTKIEIVSIKNTLRNQRKLKKNTLLWSLFFFFSPNVFLEIYQFLQPHSEQKELLTYPNRISASKTYIGFLPRIHRKFWKKCENIISCNAKRVQPADTHSWEQGK